MDSIQKKCIYGTIVSIKDCGNFKYNVTFQSIHTKDDARPVPSISACFLRASLSALIRACSASSFWIFSRLSNVVDRVLRAAASAARPPKANGAAPSATPGKRVFSVVATDFGVGLGTGTGLGAALGTEGFGITVVTFGVSTGFLGTGAGFGLGSGFGAIAFWRGSGVGFGAGLTTGDGFDAGFGVGEGLSFKSLDSKSSRDIRNPVLVLSWGLEKKRWFAVSTEKAAVVGTSATRTTILENFMFYKIK